MGMPIKMWMKVTTFLLTIAFILVPFYVQPCSLAPNLDQIVETTNNCPMDPNSDCCCANSSQTSLPDDSEQNKCPCKMTEKQQEESSPAVIVSHDDSTPETIMVACEVGPMSENYHTQSTNHSPEFLFLSSRDRLLYILYSTFLI